jgi:hypothetical protein
MSVPEPVFNGISGTHPLLFHYCAHHTAIEIETRNNNIATQNTGFFVKLMDYS